MAEYNNIDLADFLKNQLKIEDSSNRDNANKELLQIFSIKCKKNQVQPTLKNLIDYLKVYRKDSSIEGIDFATMQLEVESLLQSKFQLTDIVTY